MFFTILLIIVNVVKYNQHIYTKNMQKKYFAESEIVCNFATAKTNNSNTKYTNIHNAK